MLTCRCRLRRIPKFSQCENQNTYFSLYSTTAKQKEGEEDQQKKVTIKMFMVYIEKKGGRNNERIYKEKVH